MQDAGLDLGLGSRFILSRGQWACSHECVNCAHAPRSPFHRGINSRASDREQHPSILSALDQNTAKHALKTPRYAGHEGEAEFCDQSTANCASLSPCTAEQEVQRSILGPGALFSSCVCM